MRRLIVTDARGETYAVDAEDGESVMHVARAAGFPILGECEGSLACATCHVIVKPEWALRLPPPCDAEEAMLDAVSRPAPTSRLGCQLRFGPALDGLAVALPG